MQAAELEAECHGLRFRPRYAVLIVEGPFGLPTLIDGSSEAATLERVIERVRIEVEMMASGQAFKEIRRAIQEYRQAGNARRKQRR